MTDKKPFGLDDHAGSSLSLLFSLAVMKKWRQKPLSSLFSIQAQNRARSRLMKQKETWAARRLSLCLSPETLASY